MKHLRLLLSLVTVLCSMLYVACQETPEQDIDKNTTSISFESTSIELDGKGGTYTLGYTLKNGIEGIDIVVKSDSDWLTNLRTESSKIIFDYAQNLDNKERTASIMVTYPNIKSVLLKIKQLVNNSVIFTMEVTEQTTASCVTKITPSDPEVIYITYMAELMYLQGSGIDSAEKLFLDDYNHFMKYTEQYDIPKLKEFFLDNDIAYKGTQSISWGGMMPNNDYVLYVYAIEFNEENNDYYLASPITYQMVELNNPERGVVEFDVQIDVNGPTAEYNITPINWEGTYYLTICKEGDYIYRDANTPVDDAYSELISDSWIDLVYSLLMSGYNTNQLLELMCLSGNVTYDETLTASTNYALVIYAIDDVDGIPQVVSVPQVFNFTTEEIGPSDMTIDIKVENKYVRVADITITPSTNEPYTAAIIAKSEVPDWENSEIIAWLNSNVFMESYSGEIYNHLNTLKPETEYSILAYGYWGGVVTTDLFRVDFKMDAESECENSVIRVDHNGPYSLKELEDYNPDYYYNYAMFEDMGWYGMWGEIFTEQPTQDLFYCIYAADKLVTDGTDAIFADLVSYTCKKTALFYGENDKLYVMCAVAMDYRGNYSQMWMSEPFSYHYDESTKRPLNELIDKLNNTPAAQRKEAVKGNINHLVR